MVKTCFTCNTIGCMNCGIICDRCERYFCNQHWFGKTLKSCSTYLCHFCKKPKRPDAILPITHRDCGFKFLKKLQMKTLELVGNTLPELFASNKLTRGFVRVDGDMETKTNNVTCLPNSMIAIGLFYERPLKQFEQSNHKSSVVIYATMYWEPTDETLSNARTFSLPSY